jgi:hypothetical protein
MTTHPPDKLCATCGRPFSWRRKWADDWHEVRYCSKACKGGPGRLDRKLEAAIVACLARRAATATCCPSEVARAVMAAESGEPERWRDEMERTRRAGRRLAHAGAVIWLQKGRRVDCTTARGPVRFGRGPAFPD